MSDEPLEDPGRETADEDRLDERTALEDVELDDLPVEADPADVVDQRREVPLDDDREVAGEGEVVLDDQGGYEP
jgi:hypothetical protein